MIPVVTYIRVSTEEQDPENQRAYLERWAAERRLRILKHYVEHGVSGAVPPWERPVFRQLIEEAPRMGARALLVYELSRLVRSFNEFFTLMELVEGRLGMAVISASEREAALQNTDGLYRQVLRAMTALFAAMEREFIRQRTKAAMERLKRDGRIKNVAEARPELVSKAVEMYNQGATLGEIARSLGVSKYAVLRFLSEAGVYKPRGGVCPRCFSKMKIIETSVKIESGAYVVIEKLYCKKCGFEEVKKS
ncbi:MAG: recombinase family protein [Pyrobaculum sp.]